MPPFMDIFDEDGDDTSFNGGTYKREKMIIVSFDKRKNRDVEHCWER